MENLRNRLHLRKKQEYGDINHHYAHFVHFTDLKMSINQCANNKSVICYLI